MCAILQLVSAPLNPIPIAEHFRRSHPQCEHSYGQHIYMSKENISVRWSNALSVCFLLEKEHDKEWFYVKFELRN